MKGIELKGFFGGWLCGVESGFIFLFEDVFFSSLFVKIR